MDSEQTQEFFDAGLQSYGKALLAIYEFKGMLEDQLQNVMLAAASGIDTETRSRTRLRDFESCTAEDTPSVVGILAQPASDPSGAVATPGRLEVGVWWSPPFRPANSGRRRRGRHRCAVGKAHDETRGIPTASLHGKHALSHPRAAEVRTGLVTCSVICSGISIVPARSSKPHSWRLLRPRAGNSYAGLGHDVVAGED